MSVFPHAQASMVEASECFCTSTHEKFMIHEHPKIPSHQPSNDQLTLWLSIIVQHPLDAVVGKVLPCYRLWYLQSPWLLLSTARCIVTQFHEVKRDQDNHHAVFHDAQKPCVDLHYCFSARLRRAKLMIFVMGGSVHQGRWKNIRPMKVLRLNAYAIVHGQKRALERGKFGRSFYFEEMKWKTKRPHNVHYKQAKWYLS